MRYRCPFERCPGRGLVSDPLHRCLHHSSPTHFRTKVENVCAVKKTGRLCRCGCGQVSGSFLFVKGHTPRERREAQREGERLMQPIEPPASSQVPWKPVPTDISTFRAEHNGNPYVLVQFTTPVGMSCFFLEPGPCEQLGQLLANEGRAAASGLTVIGDVSQNGHKPEGDHE